LNRKKNIKNCKKLYEELFDKSEKAIPTILPTEGIKEHISILQRIIHNNPASML
jgi:hypothetical protein